MEYQEDDDFDLEHEPGYIEVVDNVENETRIFGEDISIEIPDFVNDLKLSTEEKLLNKFLYTEGVGEHLIAVYNNWLKTTLQSTICGRTLTTKDGNLIYFENLVIFKPRFTRDGRTEELTPQYARDSGVTYGSDLHVTLVKRHRETKEQMENAVQICIGSIPMMLGADYCYLKGKTQREKGLLGEYPKDPGGYFIVSGVEKIVLLQEQLTLNKIFLMIMKQKEGAVARMTVSVPNKSTALVEIAMDKKNHSVLKMRFPNMKQKNNQGDKYKSVNIFRVFALLHISSENAMKIIARFMKPERINKSLLNLARTLADYNATDMKDEQDPMRISENIAVFISKMEKNNLSDDAKIIEVYRVIESDLFPHLNNLIGPNEESREERQQRIIQAKIYMLAIMAARYLEYKAGYRKLDDRDGWQNKRLESAGRMMEQLCRSAVNKVYRIAQKMIDKNDQKMKIESIAHQINADIITGTFRDSFITSNWGVKKLSMKNNIAQTLVRDSIPATFAHINTVDVGISRTDRQQSLRLVQNSQWGFIDSVSTPEGENTGILKNLALTSKLTLDRKDDLIIRYLIGDPKLNLPTYVSMKIPESKMDPQDKILVNGKFLGWCDGDIVYKYLLNLRRTGKLFYDMSIVREDEWIYVDISPSRLVRPLLIVNENQELILDKLGLRDASINDMVKNGAVEYISPWEQEYIKIATSVSVIKLRLNKIAAAEKSLNDSKLVYQRVLNGENIELTIEEALNRVKDAEEDLRKENAHMPYTHCEIDPKAILSVAAALIPWPNHNQAPRNTYQVSMGKQALGIYHSNHLNRMGDGKTKVLVFPNRPVVESGMYNILGLDDLGPGQNVIIAFMAFPYTEEDSFVFKKEFLENGGFRIHKYLTYKAIVKHAGDTAERLQKPDSNPGENTGRYKYIQQAEQGNPMNGLPMLGAYLKQGDCVIGKVQMTAGDKPRNESTFLRVGEEGIVEKVRVFSDKKITTVIVKLRIMRIPEEGDKFAPRNAQKGTIGLVMSDIDLPKTASGITPDIIVNTHCIPSRMTISYLMELLASKHAAMRGVYINGAAFEKFLRDVYRQTLTDYDMNEFGYETLYSGTSGKKLDIPIYMGPVFFQALKHHVKDKVQARGTGQVKPISRQPPKGRGNKGGLRFGEMERDAGISHGASSFLRERLMYVSDAYQTVICKNCGTFAVNNDLMNKLSTNPYKPCPLCQHTDFGRCVIPYTYKLLMHLLGAMGIYLRPEFETSDEYVNRITKGIIDDSALATIGDDDAREEEDEQFASSEQDANYDFYDS